MKLSFLNIKKDILLYLSFLLLGIGATWAQVLFIREFLVIFLGGELSIGIILFAWLLGVFAGAIISGKIAKRIKERFRLFSIILLILPILFILLLFLIRSARDIFHIQPGLPFPLYKMILVCGIFMLPFSFFIGAAFPFASLSIRGEKSRTEEIGWVYILEAFCSLVGGILITFYLIPRFSPYKISFILLLLMSGILLFFFFNIGKKFFFLNLFLFLSALVIIFSPLPHLFEQKSIEKRWKGLAGPIPLVLSIDSIYQNIVIAKQKEQYSLYGNGTYISSFPNFVLYAPIAHLIMSEHPNPKDILIIGEGLEGMVSEILKYPISHLDLVALDSRLISSIIPYLPKESKKSLHDKRFSIHLMDGRYFVKRTKKRYDIVILNLPDPSTALINRYYTVEFYQEIKRILNKGGVITTRVSSSPNYLAGAVIDYLSSVYQSIHAVFPYVVVTPGQENHIFACSKKGIITSDIKVLINRFNLRGVVSPYFNPYQFYLLLEPERVKFVQKKLSATKKVALNRDKNPITYFYNLVVWSMITGGKGGSFFLESLKKIKLYYLLFPLFIFLILAIIFPKKFSNKKINSIYSIFILGFSGISIELLLIFAYQNLYGYLYQRIGMIVALFMLGMSIGAFFIIKFKNRFSSFIWLSINNLAFAIFTLLMYFTFLKLSKISSSTGEIVFDILVLGIGFLTGTGFPMAIRNFLKIGISPGITAGIIDAADHLGASIGAGITGALLLPILGIFNVTIFIIALNIFAIFLWIIEGLTRHQG